MNDAPCTECGDEPAAPCTHGCDEPPVIAEELVEVPTDKVTAVPRHARTLATLFADPELLFARAARTLENVLRTAPAFLEAVRAVAPTSLLVAEVPAEYEKLIAEGLVKFTRDSDGALLATLRNAKGHFEHSIRLNELNLTPELGSAVTNLQQQLTMGQILSEVRDTQLAIDNVNAGLLEDRLAIADSAWDQGQQAVQIANADIRTMKLLDAQSRASDARATYARQITHIKSQFDSRESQSLVGRTADRFMHKLSGQRSQELFSLLSGSMKALQVEVHVYLMLDETEAARTCLAQFAEFLALNGLDDEETLLSLHSYSADDQEHLIDSFLSMSATMHAITTGTDEPQPLLDHNATKDDDDDSTLHEV